MDEGATDCIHYKGIRFIKERQCCGGKKIKRVRINCDKISVVYAGDHCNEKVCQFYEKCDK